MDSGVQEKFLEILNAERAAFQERFMAMTPKAVYESSYEILFHQAYFDMLSSGYLDSLATAEQVRAWLLTYERPVEFLYGAWLECDAAFSEDWDDMLDWVDSLRKEIERDAAVKNAGQPDVGSLTDKMKEAEEQRKSADFVTRYTIEYYPCVDDDEYRLTDYIYADSREEAIDAFEKKHGIDCVITMCEPIEVPAQYKKYDEAVELGGR